MATTKKYLASGQLLQSAATIQGIEVRVDGHVCVRLNETIFHAQGGGQKADRGTIGDARVTHVAHAEGGEVEHFVDSIASLTLGQRVELHVDSNWRNTNARYHSGGHLMAAVIEARFPNLRAIAGHHWPGEARVEFQGAPMPDAGEIEVLLKQELSEAIARDLPVQVLGDPFSDRAIQVAGYPPVPCGGTHVQRLSELQAIHIDRIRIKSGRLRISYSVPG